MTASQTQSLVLAHIVAHTTNKGRPTYLRIGRLIADAMTTAAGDLAIDTHDIPVVVDEQQNNESVMACYGGVPADAY